MGFIFISNPFLRTKCHKCFQNQVIAMLFILNQCIQFSVGKGSCASFSELNIGFRIQFTGFKKMFYRFQPLLHRLSALDNNRTVSLFCQHIGTKQSGRTTADHHRRIGHLTGSGRYKLIKTFVS